MKVFITGATGFIGSRIVRDMLKDGYEVLGLARSQDSADALKDLGAEVHRGDVEDAESLKAGAAASDGIIHCGFIHDFTTFERFIEVCEIDRRAIEAMGSALIGTEKPFLVTSGVAVSQETRRPYNEDDKPDSPFPRVASEQAAEAMAAKGVKTIAIRLPQVHDAYKQGLITPLIAVAREKGVSAYIGDGSARWPACSVDAAARLYKLALEKGVAGARYNAVGEEGVALKAIAETIGRVLNIPLESKTAEESAGHFGWLGGMMDRDMASSSALTQQRLGWDPSGPTLLSDLAQGKF